MSPHNFFCFSPLTCPSTFMFPSICATLLSPNMTSLIFFLHGGVGKVWLFCVSAAFRSKSMVLYVAIIRVWLVILLNQFSWQECLRSLLWICRRELLNICFFFQFNILPYPFMKRIIKKVNMWISPHFKLTLLCDFNHDPKWTQLNALVHTHS